MNQLNGIRFVQKVWGSEEIICNNNEFAGKLLHLNKNAKSSYHHHPVKSEVFYVLSGLVLIEIATDSFILHPGEKVSVPPGVNHSFQGIEASVLIEFSTHDDSDDSIRLTQSVADVRVH